ncbi:MAG: hypothetical protein ACYCQJ_10140 [Nitrososphaerales archaeon]
MNYFSIDSTDMNGNPISISWGSPSYGSQSCGDSITTTNGQFPSVLISYNAA